MPTSYDAFEWFASLLAAIEEADLENVRGFRLSPLYAKLEAVRRNSHLHVNLVLRIAELMSRRPDCQAEGRRAEQHLRQRRVSDLHIC
jgi:hypothetical protein